MKWLTGQIAKSMYARFLSIEGTQLMSKGGDSSIQKRSEIDPSAIQLLWRRKVAVVIWVWIVVSWVWSEVNNIQHKTWWKTWWLLRLNLIVYIPAFSPVPAMKINQLLFQTLSKPSKLEFLKEAVPSRLFRLKFLYGETTCCQQSVTLCQRTSIQAQTPKNSQLIQASYHKALNSGFLERNP